MENMMPWIAPIIVAVISGFFSYLGVTEASKAAHDATLNEVKAEQQKQIGIIDEKINGIKEDIKRLETKQDKHNSIIERTFKLEEKVDGLIKQII